MYLHGTENYTLNQGVIRKNSNLRRYSIKENAVIKMLRKLTLYNHFPGKIWENQANIHESVRYGPYEGAILQDFRTAFPQCGMLSWIETNKYFWIRRFFHVTRYGIKRTTHFIATPNAIHPKQVKTEKGFRRALRENTWFAWATCVDGEITKVEVEVEARRCGFGSSLMYFCFLNIEHVPNMNGYDFNSDPRFNIGNMPAITVGLIEGYCTRIIYVNYQYRQYTNGMPHDSDPHDIVGGAEGGNKAFIYAALAANYRRMITFNPDPCREDCCKLRNHRLPVPQGFVVDENINNQHGKAWWIPGMLTKFNKMVPNSVNSDGSFNNMDTLMHADDFAQHQGRHWYFCSEHPPSAFNA